MEPPSLSSLKQQSANTEIMETDKDSEFLSYGLSDKVAFLRYMFLVLAAQTFLAIVLGVVLMVEAGDYMSENWWLAAACAVLMVGILSCVLCLQDVARKGIMSVLLLLLLVRSMQTGLQTAIVTYVFLNLATFQVLGSLLTLFAVDLALCVYAWTVIARQTQAEFSAEFAYILSSGVSGFLSLVFVFLAPAQRGWIVAAAQLCVIGIGLYTVYSSKCIVIEAKYTLQEHDFVYASLLIYAVLVMQDFLNIILRFFRDLPHCKLRGVRVSFNLQSMGSMETPRSHRSIEGDNNGIE